jgi:hypothetical protein
MLSVSVLCSSGTGIVASFWHAISYIFLYKLSNYCRGEFVVYIIIQPSDPIKVADLTSLVTTFHCYAISIRGMYFAALRVELLRPCLAVVVGEPVPPGRRNLLALISSRSGDKKPDRSEMGDHINITRIAERRDIRSTRVWQSEGFSRVHSYCMVCASWFDINFSSILSSIPFSLPRTTKPSPAYRIRTGSTHTPYSKRTEQYRQCGYGPNSCDKMGAQLGIFRLSR